MTYFEENFDSVLPNKIFQNRVYSYLLEHAARNESKFTKCLDSKIIRSKVQQ